MSAGERLREVLDAVAARPEGIGWVLPVLAAAPGCRWEEEVRGRLGKVRRPAGLVAGDWRFEPQGAEVVRVLHVVGGIRLAQQELPPAGAVGPVVDAVTGVAAARGEAAERELAAVIEGIATAASR